MFSVENKYTLACEQAIWRGAAAAAASGREGERQGRFSSPLLRSRVSPESLRAGYLLCLLCFLFFFREVLCVEFLYCRIVTGSADGKVGLSILSLLFRFLFVLTLHRGPSNFLVRKQKASKRLYPQNSLFSVTVISRVHLCIAIFFCDFLPPPFSAAYLEPLEWRLSSDYPWKQQK